MPSITPAQINTAACCNLGSDIRGTLIASAIVANERTPSRVVINVSQRRDRNQLTHAGHNLCFHAELIRKATCEIRDPTLAVACNIGYFSDVVEHLAASEEQNRDQADRSPKIPVLYNW